MDCRQSTTSDVAACDEFYEDGSLEHRLCVTEAFLKHQMCRNECLDRKRCNCPVEEATCHTCLSNSDANYNKCFNDVQQICESDPGSEWCTWGSVRCDMFHASDKLACHERGLCCQQPDLNPGGRPDTDLAALPGRELRSRVSNCNQRIAGAWPVRLYS
jgi:hypothetical protein